MPLPRTVELKDGRTAVVRAAEPRDAVAWIANFQSVAAERIYVMTEQFSRTPEEIRTQFARADPERELWLVAEADGRLVGGANVQRGAWRKNAHTASLGVAVVHAHRGRGIGEALVRALIDWARERGILRLKLGVFATNVAAIRLYEKLGFREEARLAGEVLLDGRPVDEVLMVLRP